VIAAAVARALDATAVVVSPKIHRLAGEFRAVVATKRFGTIAALSQSLECGDDIVRAKLLPDPDGPRAGKTKYRVLAKEFAAEGAEVFLAGRTRSALEEVAQQVTAAPAPRVATRALAGSDPRRRGVRNPSSPIGR
jgi:hypothetical protein